MCLFFMWLSKARGGGGGRVCCCGVGYSFLFMCGGATTDVCGFFAKPLLPLLNDDDDDDETHFCLELYKIKRKNYLHKTTLLLL